MIRMRSSRFICILLWAVVLTGCAHYQAGLPATAMAGPDRLHIAQVINRSYAPQVRALVSQELHAQFAQSATIQLVPNSSNAWLLQIVLGSYDREAVATRPDDTGRALSFDLQLIAFVTLISPDGTVVLDQHPVSADTTVYSTGGLVSAEHTSMPLLARSLSQRIRATTEHLW